jgi:hypothetical protein
MTDFELTARVLPEPIASTAVPPKYLQVVVTDAALNKISEVPRRNGVSFSEPLNTPGVGQITIASNDEILQAYPNLLNYGNIVQFWLGDKCVSGIRIKQKTLTFASTDEGVSLGIQVSGPTVHHMLNDFIVMHDGKPRPTSGTTRMYSWASRPGEWYNDADWAHTIRQWSLRNPPSAKKRKKPKHWRVPSAKWIGFRGEWKYFRKDFHVPKGGMHLRFFAAADEWFKLYLDGEEILSDKHREVGYREYVYCDQVVPHGLHTIGVQTRAHPSPHGDGWDNLIVAVCEINHKGRRILPPVLVSNHRWKAHKGNPPPSWNRAQVLRSMVTEARARSVQAAINLTFGFTATADSSGLPWRDRFNEGIDVGTTGLDAQSQLSESDNFDVWVDPADLSLKAWAYRGVNRSASIALMPGVNLVDYETTETDEVLNSVLIQYDKGWTSTQLKSSVDTYDKRETYAELGNIKNPRSAIRTMNKVLRGLGRTSKVSGTADIKTHTEEVPTGSIIPAEGMYPMVDWTTGDIISAFNANAQLAPHRTMSLTCTEDEQGNLSFDTELEEVDRIL